MHIFATRTKTERTARQHCQAFSKKLIFDCPSILVNRDVKCFLESAGVSPKHYRSYWTRFTSLYSFENATNRNAKFWHANVFIFSGLATSAQRRNCCRLFEKCKLRTKICCICQSVVILVTNFKRASTISMVNETFQFCFRWEMQISYSQTTASFHLVINDMSFQ